MSFSPETAAQLPAGARRLDLATTALDAPLPSDSAEEWRYSPVTRLDLDRYSPQLHPPGPQVPESELAKGCGASAIVQIDNGWVTSIAVTAGAKASGLEISLADWSDTSGDLADSNSLDQLHSAFTPGALTISLVANAVLTDPVRILSSQTGSDVASFPFIQVSVGDGAELSVIERQISGEDPGLTISRVHLTVGANATLHHSTLQSVGSMHWHLARHTTSVGEGAHLRAAIASFGGSYARLRTDADLVGRGASGELLAVYFGDADQVHDFRTFQHHSARNTQSDLVFKGTLDDRAGSIYTGMVQIHPNGAGTLANQTNHNIKLSDEAWAWSVPNLEIENNDVRCSHASTVSPVDADQRFYLHARGVPPVEADKLIVAGFFREVLDRFPVELRDEISALVSAKLDTGSSSRAVAS